MDPRKVIQHWRSFHCREGRSTGTGGYYPQTGGQPVSEQARLGQPTVRQLAVEPAVAAVEPGAAAAAAAVTAVAAAAAAAATAPVAAVAAAEAAEAAVPEVAGSDASAAGWSVAAAAAGKPPTNQAQVQAHWPEQWWW